MTADLNKTGHADFIVAAYSDPHGDSADILVLKKSSGALISELDLCGTGIRPRLSPIDLDRSGSPEILVEFGDTGARGGSIGWVFKWNGSSLVPLSPTESENGKPCTKLDESDFVDLDGDGILEIVDRIDVDYRNDANGTPNTYDVYKLVNGAYKLSGSFEYYSGFWPGGFRPMRGRSETFTASNPKEPYVVIIANGDGRDRKSVQSADIPLNGEPVTTPGQITQSVRSLKIPVTVKAKNTVDVKVTGPKGSVLIVGIGPASLPNSQSAARSLTVNSVSLR